MDEKKKHKIKTVAGFSKIEFSFAQYIISKWKKMDSLEYME